MNYSKDVQENRTHINKDTYIYLLAHYNKIHPFQKYILQYFYFSCHRLNVSLSLSPCYLYSSDITHATRDSEYVSEYNLRQSATLQVYHNCL